MDAYQPAYFRVVSEKAVIRSEPNKLPAAIWDYQIFLLHLR